MRNCFFIGEVKDLACSILWPLVCQALPPVLPVTYCIKIGLNIVCTWWHTLPNLFKLLCSTAEGGTLKIRLGSKAAQSLSVFFCRQGRGCPFLVLHLFEVPQDSSAKLWPILLKNGSWCNRMHKVSFLQGFPFWKPYCVLWHHLSAGASGPTRDRNVKSPHAAMLFVQYKSMVRDTWCNT